MIQILKEIEIEQNELYERYKVERTMQAEEYQKRLKELLLTKEEYEKRMIKYRKKMELMDNDRYESGRKANEEAERLRREAAAIEAAEKEKDRLI